MGKRRTANLLGALATAVAERLEGRLKSHSNHTDSASAALNLLSFFDGCSNHDLARALKLSHTATVRLVDKLEAAALVKRRPGSDHRTLALCLTPAGRRRAREIVNDRSGVLDVIVSLLTPDQQGQLGEIAATVLSKLTTSVDEACHICRLCDDTACPEACCPVHQTALKLEV